MAIELQPCPFCGWSMHEDCMDEEESGKFFFWVVCGKCHASGPSAYSWKEAYRLWNERNSEPDMGCEETER